MTRYAPPNSEHSTMHTLLALQVSYRYGKKRYTVVPDSETRWASAKPLSRQVAYPGATYVTVYKGVFPPSTLS